MVNLMLCVPYQDLKKYIKNKTKQKQNTGTLISSPYALSFLYPGTLVAAITMEWSKDLAIISPPLPHNPY